MDSWYRGSIAMKTLFIIAVLFVFLFGIWILSVMASMLKDNTENGESIPLDQRVKSIKHNARMFLTDRNDDETVVAATVGYRPDPIYKQDGFMEVQRETGDKNATEYQRVIREAKK
jgi:hypothetical protein